MPVLSTKIIILPENRYILEWEGRDEPVFVELELRKNSFTSYSFLFSYSAVIITKNVHNG